MVSSYYKSDIVARGQKFCCLLICIEYIEFMMHYLSSCQCFSQSEFHPSPEGKAINVWSVLLETKGF